MTLFGIIIINELATRNKDSEDEINDVSNKL